MKKLLLPFLVFITVYLLHFLYSIWHNAHVAARWVGTSDLNSVKVYLGQQTYYMGLSYALAASFTVYAVLKFVQNRKANAGGVVGGITITGLLYFGGCFLTGCCGSPMLAVYLGLFGPSVLGLAKPITLILTALSVAVGYVCLNRRKEKDVCCGDDCSCGEKL